MNRLKALETVAEAARTYVKKRGMSPTWPDLIAAVQSFDALPADPTPAEVEQAHSYLARLLQNTHPQCEPLPDLWGLCTQIDNMVTEIPKLRAEVKQLREALERIANHPEANVVLTDYGPDGKQRVWPTVEQEARAALAKEPPAEASSLWRS